jgi:DNA-binding transcriptional LysR family regulator
MEFYHLRSFVVVAKTGNLTAAAKQLCTTPPAISAHIKNLEDELKTTLFTRSSKGMSLTGKGKLLLPKAEKTLDSAIDMVNLAAKNQNEIIGNFTLAINQPAKQIRVSELLQNINDNCSGIQINLEYLSTGAAIEQLQKSMIDGAYIYGDVPEDIFVMPIKSQKITTIAPYNSSLYSDSLLTELSNTPWVTMGNQCPFDKALSEKLKNFTKASIQTHNDETRLELVSANKGLSFIEFEEAINAVQNKKIKVLPQLDFEITLFCAFKQSRIDEPIVKTIIQELKVLWGV